MASVHWVAESGEVDPQAVCTIDYSDEGTAVDFAHHLYRSVHGYGRSRLGFVIKDEAGQLLYSWRWDGVPLGSEPGDETRPFTSHARPSVQALEKLRQRARLQDTHVVWARQAAVRLANLRDRSQSAQLRLGRGLQAAASAIRRTASGLPAKTRRLPSLWRRVTRWERPIDPEDRRPGRFLGAFPRALSRVRPGGLPKVWRWRPEIDHYLLAFIVVLAVFCGSPLYSVYSTVQRIQRDETVLRKDRSGNAAATRDATKSALSTNGKLDLRKLFWHLRVVGPTEIHVLAYEPADGDGPRLVFGTDDLLRWRLRSVRGADGTWWARADLGRRFS